MKLFLRCLTRGCTYTVLISFLFFAFVYSTAEDAVNTNIAMSLPQYSLILLFGVALAVSELIFLIPNLKYPVKLLSHYLITLAIFFAVFGASGKLKSSAAYIFTAAVLFTVIYFICTAIVFSINKLAKKVSKEKEPTQEYKKLYK